MSTNQTASKSGLDLNGGPFFTISGGNGFGRKCEVNGVRHGGVNLDGRFGNGGRMSMSGRLNEAPSAFFFGRS